MKKKVFFFISFALIYLLIEAGLRLVLCISAGAGFFRPSDIIYRYYPEIIPLKHAAISNTDSTLDVLILSCSVLHKDWADIVSEMNNCIQLPGKYKNLKIYNASGIGHGSRDNLIKYRLLHDKKFDVVIYYDAINDSRLNNCPDDVFKTDYSHYRWYDEINTIIKHKEMDLTVIPFFCEWVYIKLKPALNKNTYIPRHYSLRPGWQVYGSHLKSVACYRANLQEVINEARSQNSRFLYLTFAYYPAPGYTLQKFHDKTLDYTFCDHSRETEIWGQVQNVSTFIDTINAASKSWIAPYKNARRADINAGFPKEGKYFADICHFSPQGIHYFASMACSQLDSTLNNQ